MTKNINIELTDEEFEELKKIKERLGLAWKGFLMVGASEAKELELPREKEAEEDG